MWGPASFRREVGKERCPENLPGVGRTWLPQHLDLGEEGGSPEARDDLWGNLAGGSQGSRCWLNVSETRHFLRASPPAPTPAETQRREGFPLPSGMEALSPQTGKGALAAAWPSCGDPQTSEARSSCCFEDAKALSLQGWGLFCLPPEIIFQCHVCILGVGGAREGCGGGAL